MLTELKALFSESSSNFLIKNRWSFTFSEDAAEKVSKRSEIILDLISSDFFEKETNKIITDSNEFALIFPSLITEEQINEAKKQLVENFKQGRYPLLLGKMKTASDLFVKNTNNMFERLNSKKAEIEKEIFEGKVFTSVVDIDFDARKTVCGSTCANVTITTDKGKVLYKPHDCTLDYNFHKLNNLYFRDCFKTPRVVKGSYDYGFCEFMTNKVAKTDQDAKKYFENMGKLSAVLCFTQGTDCNSKNLFVDNSFPVLIDLEMIVHPILVNESDKTYMFGNLEYKRSLAQRGILPCTDAEGHEISPAMPLKVESLSRVPIVNGRKKTVLEYKTEFIKGFETTFRYCLSIKNQLAEWAESLNNAHLRIIHGQYSLFSKISDILNSHQALLSKENQRNTISAITEKTEYLLTNRQTQNESIRIAAMGELPYYYVKMRDTCLFGNFGLKVQNYLKKTPLDTLKETIHTQDEKYLKFNLALIEKSFADCQVEEPSKKEKLIHPQTAKDRINDLFLKIRDHFIETPSGYRYLVGNTKGNPLSPENEIGANGKLGVSLFFKTYASYYKDCAYATEASELANQLILEVDEAVESINEGSQIGDCEGLSGTLKCALLINKLEKSHSTEALISHLCNKISNLDFDKIFLTDKYSGLAGLLTVYCLYEEIPERNKIIAKTADRLLSLQTLKYKEYQLWDTILKNRPISGAAHGMVGIFQALFLAYKATGEQKYLKASLDAFEFENEIYSEKLSTWPDLREETEELCSMHGFCSGAPGIGNILISLFNFKNDIPNYDKNLTRAINFCLNHNQLYKDHLCCGNAAVADFFINLYVKTEEKEYLDKAKSLLLPEFEYQYSSSEYKNAFSNSLYFGGSGIGYELLRLNNPYLYPSVLI